MPTNIDDKTRKAITESIVGTAEPFQGIAAKHGVSRDYVTRLVKRLRIEGTEMPERSKGRPNGTTRPYKPKPFRTCQSCRRKLRVSEFYKPDERPKGGGYYICRGCNTTSVRKASYRRDIRDNGLAAFLDKIRHQVATVDLMLSVAAEFRTDNQGEEP